MSNVCQNFPNAAKISNFSETFQLHKKLSNFARFFPTSLGSFKLKHKLSNFKLSNLKLCNFSFFPTTRKPSILVDKKWTKFMGIMKFPNFFQVLEF